MLHFGRYSDLLKKHSPKNKRPFIITDDNLQRLYVESLVAAFNIPCFSIKPGEASKTRETKQAIEDVLLAQGFGRDTVIIAFGGGVVTDLAGFVAATYCRGVPVIYIPTSLLAMVDAAVGGKTAVNTPLGKNMIGAFKQPDAVIIDVSVLKTLPQQEIYAGMSEHIKHALIADADLFVDIAAHIDRLNDLPIDKWQTWVQRSCAIKQAIVLQDFTEQGLRAVLNVGHTVAHALEQVSDYQISHGEAVAIGLQIETEIAVQMGLLDSDEALRIIRVLQAIPFDSAFQFSQKHLPAIMQAMQLDKKAQGGQPNFCLLAEIGRVARNANQGVLFPVPQNVIIKGCQTSTIFKKVKYYQ